MAILFPAYVPTSWSLTLPGWSVITNNWRSSEFPEVLGSLPEDARLSLRYENVTNAEALELVLLWRATAGGMIPIEPLPTQVATGISSAALADRILDVAPMAWTVAAEPRQEAVKAGRSTVEIELRTELALAMNGTLPVTTCPGWSPRAVVGCAGGAGGVDPPPVKPLPPLIGNPTPSPTTWLRTVFHPSSPVNEGSYVSARLANGNIAVGMYRDTDPGDRSGVLIISPGNGDILYSAEWTGFGTTFISPISSGGFLLRDSAQSFMLFDDSASVIWRRTLTSGATSFVPFGAATDSNGNIIIAGSPSLIKFDPSWNIIWQVTVATSGGYAVVDSSGNIYCPGSATYTNSFGKTRRAMSCVKLTAAGSVVWAKQYVDPRLEGVGSTINTFATEGAAIDSSGVYAISRSTVPGSPPRIQCYKFDFDGNIIWAKELTRIRPAPDGNEAQMSGSGIVVGSDGSVYIGGDDYTSVLAPYLLKLDPSGNFVFDRSIPVPFVPDPLDPDFPYTGYSSTYGVQADDSHVYLSGEITILNPYEETGPGVFDASIYIWKAAKDGTGLGTYGEFEVIAAPGTSTVNDLSVSAQAISITPVTTTFAWANQTPPAISATTAGTNIYQPVPT